MIKEFRELNLWFSNSAGNTLSQDSMNREIQKKTGDIVSGFFLNQFQVNYFVATISNFKVNSSYIALSPISAKKVFDP